MDAVIYTLRDALKWHRKQAADHAEKAEAQDLIAAGYRKSSDEHADAAKQHEEALLKIGATIEP